MLATHNEASDASLAARTRTSHGMNNSQIKKTVLFMISVKEI